MLRYDRQTKPGLVALYDIRPENGAGSFLQPRSPHGADGFKDTTLLYQLRSASIDSEYHNREAIYNCLSFSLSTLLLNAEPTVS